MFLIRTAFWLTIVVALIPVQQSDLGEGERSISTFETVALAQSVASDLGSFCQRNQQTCNTGAILMSQMGAKAREGARIAYTWLDERYGSTDRQSEAVTDTIKTSSIK
jgi:hypothetical protein